MILIFFPRDTIKIYQEISDPEKCGKDQYGKPKKCKKLKCTVQGDLQNVAPSQSMQGFGTLTHNTHHLYLNQNTFIKNTDSIEVEGYNGYFEIVGEPMIYNSVIPHILVLLRHIE